ncbi:SpoIIE family protein phosphatase [Streptacidiphilus rugosus]|uniref:SpoIIE family protein phosphatase n=1 Tax=Streptacidiphilus rugosus TaxID=405783 RepID=UPI000A5206A6|nr:SpoIIE family protein phosphatase [Streptacidiphilus rugosus]
MGAEAPKRDAAATAIEAAAAAMAVSGDALLGGLVAELPFGVALLDPGLRWLYANEAFARHTGVTPESFTGRPLADTPLASAGPAARTVLSDGLTRQVEPAAPARSAAIRLQRLTLDDRVTGVLAVTGLAPEPDAPSADRDAPVHEVPDPDASRLALLTAAGEVIGSTLDTDTTCVELARFTVPELADLATVDILPPGVPDHRLGAPLGSLRLLRAAVAGTPELYPQLATLAHPGESVRHREGSLVALSLVGGKPVTAQIRDEETLARALSDTASREVFRAAEIASVVAVPLTARGSLLGVLTLARADAPGDGFSDDDITLIQDLAGRAALSIDNARRYTRSQGIALELQRALLAEPANPHPNLEIACRYLPSGSSSVVGGDWYESVRLPFGRTLLVIGDVMGHGVEAAVDMSTYRSMLRYVAAMDLPPHRILRQLDSLISENESARPATCLLALVDPSRDRVTFSSAGHLPPALVGADRATELVTLPSGPPLGTGVGGYQQLVRELTPGQVLLLYTDGLVERRREDIDVSLERLAAAPLPATGDLDDLIDAALHNSSPSDAEDDIALLAARVRPRRP